jgi:multiple sugar transport system permease protein
MRIGGSVDSGMRPATGFLYVLPALLFVGLLTLYPFGQLVYMSLHNWSLLGGASFVGLRNYVRAFNDDFAWAALGFTLKYTLLITPILMGFGYLAALLTVGSSRLERLTRAVIFLPVVIGLASSSLLWFWLFDQQVGLFNKLLTDLGLISVPLVWFGDAELGLWAVIISVAWKVVGFGMILFVAAIQAIPDEIHEASMIDGASYWQRVRRITLPLTFRTILLATLISAIGSMLAFEQFYIMTAGGPMNQTISSVYWIYTNSFTYFKLGYGATLSIILMTIIFVASAVQIALTRRRWT